MSDEGDPKGVGRRETLGLATLVAALGAGLAVSFTAPDAEAQAEGQLQLKIYRRQQKEESTFHTITLTPEQSKLLTDPGTMVQLKWFSTGKDSAMLAESSLMQLKLPQAAPAPSSGWDIRKNQKT